LGATSRLSLLLFIFATSLIDFFFHYKLLGYAGATRFASGPAPELPPIKTVLRGKVVTVAHKLGTPEQECPEWLVAADKDQLPQPERLAFTPPPRGEG